MMGELTAKKISLAVVHAKNSPFNIRKNDCVVANVSWGLFEWVEADIIALTKSGYLIEGEIKISKDDFLKDRFKKKWNEDSKWKRDIKRFFYIVPDNLSEFALENTDKNIISVSITETRGYLVKILRNEGGNIARRLFMEEKMQLMRLGSMRAWK